MKLPDLIRAWWAASACAFCDAEVTLLSVGFSIGEISYRNNIGKDMVLEMRYRGEPLEAGTLLQKTAEIDLVLGNGKRN